MPEIETPSIQTAFRSLARSALDLFLPLHCVGCRREGAVICARCIAGLHRLEQPFCDTCAQLNVNGQCQSCLEHTPSIDGIRSPTFSKDHCGRRYIASSTGDGGWPRPSWAGCWPNIWSMTNCPEKCWSRCRSTPAACAAAATTRPILLAKEAEKLLELPVRDDLVKRAKDSPPQVEARSRQQRRVNVAASFEASAQVKGLSILLIYDVATTGSTLYAYAAALKDAGDSGFWGLVLARDN